ncbi:GGDEF domain-containing protein [Robinsoniella peoriensis]|uniref:GGDEF domain-containing protein n=1 Tax=Robinsoniella peoriensis TaxID=180332 RepID=UPI0037512592
MIELKKYLGFPLEKSYEEPIEKRLLQNIKRSHIAFQGLIIAFQIIMMLSISLRPGGPFYKPRRTAYFSMYVILALITLIVMVININFVKKQSPNHRFYFRINYFYMGFLCLWSTAVTLNDQLGGNGLTVFTYVMLTVAVLTLTKPWHNILIMGGNFLLLNYLLPYFPDPHGADQTFNNLMNSLFTTALAIAISTIFYRNRVRKEYDQIIINEQYNQINDINTQLHQEVLTDKLTGLYNRRYLDDIVKNIFRKNQEAHHCAACMMIDIDFFKQYNDTYGHQAGDNCLAAVSQLFARNIQDEDACLIRYGGEEFLIFLFGDSSRDANVKAEVIRSAAEQGMYHTPVVPKRPMTISIGLYQETPMKETDMERFIFRADQALYEAKKHGRNCVFEYQQQPMP